MGFDSEVEVEVAKGSCTADLCSELSSYHLRCTQAVEEKDYNVMFSIAGVH
jgi:hypothetical protein